MKNILCIGGAGQLGSKVISIFSKHKVVNVDFREHPSAHQNILLKQGQQVETNNKLAIDGIKSLGMKFNAILVTAGGWTGGSIKEDNYYDQVKLMSEVCLYPSLLGAHLATKHLSPGGLVVFTGAAAVYKEPQSDMIGYAIAKSGVHYLGTALAEKAKDFQGNVVTILPEVIDTESNRQAMPTAKFDTWSKPEQIGQLLLSWV
jgi:dihydropteridine reductase